MYFSPSPSVKFFWLLFFQIKMSERLKLRRKRIGGAASNNSYQPTNRVNKFLSQAIEARFETLGRFHEAVSTRPWPQP
jgi:hypothetical protein